MSAKEAYDMKKWIVPLIVVILETILCVMLLSPIVFNSMPGFIQSILKGIESVFTTISKGLRLPASIFEGESNYVISNFIVLFIVDLIIFFVNFLIFFTKSLKKKKQKLDEDEIVESPKSEFDPILFEKRFPTKRLAFIWIPVNLWILYFLLLNSKDLQESFLSSNKFIYSVFHGPIELYNKNFDGLSNNDLAIKIIIFVIGFLGFIFVYWMILSILAVIFRKPFAKHRSKKALKDHERRASACKNEEVIIENLEILEHAKFKHDKSIVETIADIDKSKNPAIITKSDYFDDVIHGITDLGIVNQELKVIEKPKVERKPIRIMYASDMRNVDDVIENVNEGKNVSEVAEEKSNNQIIIDKRFDVLEKNDKTDNEQEEIKENNEDNTQKHLVRPIKPKKLRDPVSVSPVSPIRKDLKEELSTTPIIEIEDK